MTSMKINVYLSKSSINYCSNHLAKAYHHLKKLLIHPYRKVAADLERGTQETPQLNWAGLCHVDRDAHTRHSNSHPHHNPAC